MAYLDANQDSIPEHVDYVSLLVSVWCMKTLPASHLSISSPKRNNMELASRPGPHFWMDGLRLDLDPF